MTLDLRKQRFGRLTAIEPTEKRYFGSVVWQCLCDCHNICEVPSQTLRSGDTLSCGCLNREKVAKRFTTHGMSKTFEFKAWLCMIQRCENPNNTGYENYGGRGISISKEFHDFQVWYEHIGSWPGLGYSQDRIDNEGNYERGNIRWATQTEQHLNTRPISCGPFKQYWFLGFNTKTGEWDEDNNQCDFARRWNLNSSEICMCLTERRPTHKNWIFQRLEERNNG